MIIIWMVDSIVLNKALYHNCQKDTLDFCLYKEKSVQFIPLHIHTGSCLNVEKAAFFCLTDAFIFGGSDVNL